MLCCFCRFWRPDNCGSAGSGVVSDYFGGVPGAVGCSMQIKVCGQN